MRLPWMDFRKADSHPSQIDPLRPVSYLHSGHSSESAFYQLSFYEAAVGDITLPPLPAGGNVAPIAAIQTGSLSIAAIRWDQQASPA